MFGTLRGRIITILIAAALAAYSLIVNGIKPGLDLQGGMHLALEIADPDGTMTPEAIRDAVDQNVHVIRNRIDQFGVSEPLVQKVGDHRIIVELPGIRDEERAKAIIAEQAYLEWKLVRSTTDLTNVLERIDRLVAQQLPPDSLAAVPGAPASAAADTGAAARQRALQDLAFGVRGDSAARDSAAADTAQVEALPTLPDRRPFSGLLQTTGADGEFLVAKEDVTRAERYLALPGVLDVLPRGTELRWAAEETGANAALYRSLYILEREAFITGASLEGATATRDPQFNQTVVTFQLDRRGGRKFEEVTTAHIGDRIAIVLDGEVHSAPVVRGRIASSGQIEMGQATMQEASDLALVLRAGALPAPLAIVEQRSVGPSLGRDSIDQGKIAGIIGIVLVIVIMVGYYRLAGAMAVLALGFYLLFVMGGLAGLGAALTAPGIAGLILSLGMAVDANVLIFERIREELIASRSPRAAVDAGFQHAMSAIVDSNLTTLITALILYQVGTGPVQGFAVTLSIGIIASFFTAVYITRTFFLIYLDRKRPTEPISI